MAFYRATFVTDLLCGLCCVVCLTGCWLDFWHPNFMMADFTTGFMSWRLTP